MEDSNHCDYDSTDDVRAGRWLMKKGLDIKTCEFNSCRRALKRSVEDPNLSKSPEDKDYMIFLNSFLLERREPGSSLNDEDDDKDPQYRMFLENLKEEGESYKLELPIKNRIVSIIYEKEDESDGDEYDIQFPVKKSRALGNVPFGSVFQHELCDDDDDMDECHRIFLKSVKVEGDCVVYANEGQSPIKLEEFDVECDSDCKVLIATNASEFNDNGCNPFQTTNLIVKPETKQLCLGSGEGEIESGFKKKLMAKLREPFDNKEYFKLWDEINEEKPKTVHRDLRGPGVVRHLASDEPSPSYLTRYAPLRRKIASANQRQRLSYLRAFFFWLQYVAHEDAFQPWLDKSCLELMGKGC